MRIISGRERGRRLAGPKSDKIRPVLDKIKQAIFNILGDVEGLTVLDLFAGTGSIGIEALSRGATFALFVDFGTQALQLIRKNLNLCFLQEKAEIIRLKIPRDLSRLSRRFDPFDLIFVDPPYDKGLVDPTLEAIAREKILAPQGTVVVEHSPRELIASEYRLDRIQSVQSNGASDEIAAQQMGVQGRAASPLSIYDQRKYGQTLISFFKEN